MHFLVVYDRAAGKLIEQARPFVDRAEAMQARYDVEKLYEGDVNVETVVLDAASETALHSTHARYFMTLTELAVQTRGDGGHGTPTPPRPHRYQVPSRTS